jgi:cytochrome b6-f complex iron-sulfur subunit
MTASTPSTELNHPPLKQDSKLSLDRKGFLGLAFAGSLAALAGGWLGALLKFLRPPQAQGFGGQVYAGRLEEFPPGSVSRIMAGRFYLTHTEDGLLAVYQKCTHLGCSVPWAEAEGQFHCPCHGSLFSRTGEVAGGPAPRPLDIFPVEVKNGEVWVDTGRPVERSRYEPGQAYKV